VSIYDPTDFQDLASLFAVRQRSNQIDATKRQMHEVAALKVALKSQLAKSENEEIRKNNLFSLKVRADEINSALTNGEYVKAYDLIKREKERYIELGLKQEHFSSLEYKNLAEDLSKYFSEILNYFASITPLEILIELKAKDEWVEDYSANLVKEAEAGDPVAQCNLGVCYENGQGVSKDEKEAVKWYTKSADQGNRRAQCNLGLCYENGAGVQKDEKEAVKWYHKSSDQGDATAQRFLGGCYTFGIGVTKDGKKGIKWLIKSAEQGDAIALYNIGFCYAEGEGVAQDYNEAVKWYTKSAEQGNADAMEELKKIKAKL
jgi:TPR repeat protein